MVVEASADPLLLVPLLGRSSLLISYILALAAVFLLAFRGRWADRAISVILAALWAWMAVSMALPEALLSRSAAVLAALSATPAPGLAGLPAALREAGRQVPLTWLAAAFFLQGLLFLAAGLRSAPDGRSSRLAFEPRAGAGPVAGGVLLLYSLVLHPLLAALGVRGFPDLLLGLPFHGLLFTFGLLLFLEQGFPRHVLALPLAWTALGGLAAFDPGLDPDFGLLAGLLAGAFLALPRRKTVPDAEGNLRRESWYEHAARHHRACGRGVLALLLLTCLIGLARAHAASPLSLDQLGISSAALSALLLGLWLSLPAWYSSGFRLLGWEAGRWLRASRRRWDWLRWGGIALLAGLLAYGGWAVYDGWKDTGQAAGPRTEESSERTTDLIVAGLALAMLYVIYRARRRIIISEFTNHTGDTEMADLAKGLASRLQNELAGITSLYRTIDEAMPPQKDGVVGVIVGVEDVVSSLENVLGPDKVVKLGKIGIPVGLLFRGLNSLAGGPRLTGGLHRQGKHCFLTATLAGGGLSGSWRVSFADLAEGELAELGIAAAPPAGRQDEQKDKADTAGAAEQEQKRAEKAEKDAARAAVYRMAEHLAYRIVASVGNVGSPRWEAVRSFTLGLRAYRGTQHVKGDASPELRAAEREFIQALSLDRDFSQCHYNLGVIYQALGVPESAEAAYRQVLAENPDWAEAYYALALLHFESASFARSAIFARKMIEIRPGDARAWNLNGLARFFKREKEAQDREELEQEYSGPAWDETVQSFEIAAAVAWRSLCRASLRVSAKSLSKETQLAVRCTNNLAIMKVDEGDGGACRKILEESLRISPRNPRAHLVCGESLSEERQWPEARTELHKVFGDASIADHVERLLYLLGMPTAKTREELRRSYARLLVHIVPPEGLILDSGQDAGSVQKRREEYGTQLKTFETSLLLIRRKIPSEEDPFGVPMAAIRFLRDLEVEGRVAAEPRTGDADFDGWAAAQVEIHRGRHLLAGNPGMAAESIQRAIQRLEEAGLSRQVERQGLYSLLARARLLASARQADAGADPAAPMRFAERSVAQEPESSARHWILADAYSALGDFEEACAEREAALRLGPGYEVVSDAEALDRIARDYLRLIGPREAAAPEARVRRGLRFFERVLQIVESRRPSRTPAQCMAHAAAHFWMGKLHCELGETGAGLDHLRIARSMRYHPVEVALQMGNLFSYGKDYDEADRAFFESLRALRRGAGRGGGVPRADSGPAAALEVEALLSRAMLWAERGIRLAGAARLCRRAGARLRQLKGEPRNHLRALHAECLGWILFREGKTDDGLKELERAARLSGSRSIQARLASVYEAKRLTEKAAEARGKAGPAGNGHGKGVFDLWLKWPPPAPAAPAP